MKTAQEHIDRGLRAQGRGRFAEAAKHFVAGLRLAPDVVEALNNLGWCELQLDRPARAVAALRRAHRLRPSDPVVLSNLAGALRVAGEMDAAVEALQGLGRLRPGPVVDRDLAALLWSLGRVEESLEPAERLAAGSGATLNDRSLLLQIRRALCLWDGLDAFSDQALATALAADPGYAGSPFRYFSQIGDPALLREIAARAARAAAERAGPGPKSPAMRRGGDGPLRVGFISADFRDHPTMKLVAGLLDRLDPARFVLHIYALGPDSDDPRRTALRARAAAFRPVEGRAAAIAATIRSDRLDLLVDLMGYTRGARADVLALRPAPRQLSWLVMPGTTGAPFIDGVIVDGVIAPREAEAAFSERLHRLAPTYFVFDDRSFRPSVRPERAALGLPSEGLVFASLNQSFKIDPMRFDTWMRVLAATPASALWLLDTNDLARTRLRAAASASGVDPARIVFAPRVPHEEHYRRLPAADLVLDTWLYGGHTTTIDALWCGVPVITRIGPTFSSRVAASILAAAGLDEFVCGTEEAYLSLALRFAGERAFRETARTRVETLPAQAPPFGTDAFARAFETVLTEACA